MFQTILNSQFNPDIRIDLNRAVTDSKWTLQHMCLFKKIPAHSGCVNTIQWNSTGDLILSGSDDKKLAVSSYIDGKVIQQVRTLHKANIFSAKFLPATNDKKVVSCSGDGVIIISDLERNNTESQDVFNCHLGTVYDVVTIETEPNSFLSIGEDGTARWFDLRVNKSCQVPHCKEGVLFTYQTPLTSVAVNSKCPYEIAVGTSNSHVYVMDRRKLGREYSTGASVSQSIISNMSVPGLSQRPYQITSVEFSPEGDQLLASYSGEGVYLFDVKDPCSISPMKTPKLDLEELFNGNPDYDSTMRRRARHWHNFRRIRLRGDWSDTGPSAGTEPALPSQNNISQARPNVQASFMQRMADVLTSMMNRSSQRVASPTSPVGSPVGSPVSEPSFPVHSGDSVEADDSAPQPTTDRPEIIDCVTYESLWRSETQSENQESNPGQNLDSGSGSGSANIDVGRHINDAAPRLETTFSSFRIRQESEYNSGNLSCSIPREGVDFEAFPLTSTSETEVEVEPSNVDLIYQPNSRVGYFGHRNARTIINEATFWGKAHIMSGSDCGHVFIWNRFTGKVVHVLQADRHVVNRVRPHPYEPLLATAGIDYDVKLWIPSPSSEHNINVEELMARNARMLEETRDTITVPATFMIRMLASMSNFRRAGTRNSSDESLGLS